MIGLADEQAALRRVATLVARQASQAEVFAAMAEELGGVLGVHDVRMIRYDVEPGSVEPGSVEPGSGGAAVVVASWGRLHDVLKIGERHPVGGENVTSRVFRTGAPARLDDYSTASGAIAERVAHVGTRSAVATPITVAGRLWGAMIAAAVDGGPLPPDTESRLGQFTELMGTQIANTEARIEIARLGDEQAALRRVATLVARGAPPAEVFQTVAEEVGRLLAVASTGLLRYEPDETVTLVGGWGRFSGLVQVGKRLPLGGVNVTSEIARTGQSARYDRSVNASGALGEHARNLSVRAAAGSPILVAGRLWGAMTVAADEGEPLPIDVELRLAQFTELVATAIANTEARVELARLADEQAALRRLALRVAQGAEPDDVFDAVVAEFHRLIGATEVGLMRHEGADEAVILAHRGQDSRIVHAGMRVVLDGDSATAQVLRTGRSARVDHTGPTGTIADIALRSGITVAAGAPIVVEGRVWGVLTAAWRKEEQRPPDDVEQRMAVFAELLDTAIATADSRDQLRASRARVLSAGDEARRRVVRDLHDGAQQRLVHTIITLKLAQRALCDNQKRAEPLIAEALENAERSNGELRELAHGLLPSVLTRGGLRSGVDTVISRLDLPVEVDVTSMRFAPEIEASAYFVVAEALTNAVKHARATSARVIAVVEGKMLRVEVGDDGAGGADPDGHGLTGIRDRVAALGGSLRIASSPGGGTALAAEFPLSD